MNEFDHKFINTNGISMHVVEAAKGYLIGRTIAREPGMRSSAEMSRDG
jgi:hypothetical protein